VVSHPQASNGNENPDTVDDLTQSVFLHGEEYRLSTFGLIPGLALLKMIAKHAINDHARFNFSAKRDMRKTKLLGDTEAVDLSTDPATDAEQREGNARVRRALAELSPQSREAVTLQLDGYSRREAAERLGIAPGVYQGRLNRALEELRRLL
jgi:RNA polymerase sigma factor (sigma-70 family)